MKPIFQWFIFVVGLLAFGAVGVVCTKHTEGFTHFKIANNFSGVAANPHPLNAEVASLGQEFRYYKRGAQSFVFLSKDESCMLKVFNNRLKRQRALFHALPFSYPRKKAIEERLKTTFNSYHIAATSLLEETGIIFANLAPNPSADFTITLIDKIGIKQRISLQNCGFLLQKKSELVYPAIKKSMKEGNRAKAHHIISSLITLVSQCHEKGVLNEDPSIRKNFGLQGDGCMVIDVGRLVNDDTLNTRSQAQKVHHFHRFRKWLKKKYPELVDYFDERIGK